MAESLEYKKSWDAFLDAYQTTLNKIDDLVELCEEMMTEWDGTKQGTVLRDRLERIIHGQSFSNIESRSESVARK